MKIEWWERVTRQSRSVLNQRQLLLPQTLPNPEDVRKLGQYLTDNLHRSGEVEAIPHAFINCKNINDLDKSLIEELSEILKFLKIKISWKGKAIMACPSPDS